MFAQYIQHITTWLQANPNEAISIAFIISLTESLAIIGAIIPGTVTMTTIGVLAGSGLMRIDLTILATLLGAISGDLISYALGYAFRDTIHNLWPFTRYPRWLEYGKKYFYNHSWKGILIGRFISPIRSIIPMIAGMMHMHYWRFFIVNFFAALAWTIVYLLPGILIGAASIEFSWKKILELLLVFCVAISSIIKQVILF